MSWIFQSENLSNNCFFYFYLSLSCSLPVSSYLPLHYLSIYLSIFQYYLYLSHSACLSLSLFLCPIALSITCSYLFLFISFAFSLTLSLSFSSFLLMSASFLPSSNILSFMYRVLSKLCKCVDCKSMCLNVKTFVFSVCDIFFIFLP